MIFAICFFIIAFIVRSGFGLSLLAIRENEQRAKMLGYDVSRLKLIAIVISGVMSGAAGAAYALLFGYSGATFATVQFYLIDFSSSITPAYMLIAGLVLVLLTLFAPQGIAGELRKRFFPNLP